MLRGVRLPIIFVLGNDRYPKSNMDAYTSIPVFLLDGEIGARNPCLPSQDVSPESCFWKCVCGEDVIAAANEQ